MTRQLGLVFKSASPAPAVVRTVRPPNARIDPCPDAPRPFVGAPVTLQSPRRCAVCGGVMEVGRVCIVAGQYAAHVGCGRTRP